MEYVYCFVMIEEVNVTLEMVSFESSSPYLQFNSLLFMSLHASYRAFFELCSLL